MSLEAALSTAVFPEETRVDVVPLEEMTLPVVRQGIAYWHRLRGERAYPSRDEIRVRDIPGLLKHMVVAKALEDYEDFQLKIVGDEVCRCYRAPIINRTFREIAAELPNMARRWRSFYQRVARSGIPEAVVVMVGRDVPEINFTHAEIVCLPFGPVDGPVDHIVTFGQHLARPGN